MRVREQFAIDKARFDKLRFICKASEFPAIQRSKLTYDKFKWALCMVRSRFVSSFDNELAQMDVSWLELGTSYDSGQGSLDGTISFSEDEGRYMLDESVQRSPK